MTPSVHVMYVRTVCIKKRGGGDDGQGDGLGHRRGEGAEEVSEGNSRGGGEVVQTLF